MIVYRITSESFKADLSGNGAALYGSRWNSKGLPLLYTSQFISLSILESLVHLNRMVIPGDQYLLYIEFPERTTITELPHNKIKRGWYIETEYTQWLGDQFLKNDKSLVLKVPSVIVPQENNFLFNPLHIEFKKVKIINSELLQLDKRLSQY